MNAAVMFAGSMAGSRSMAWSRSGDCWSGSWSGSMARSRSWVGAGCGSRSLSGAMAVDECFYYSQVEL